MTLRFYMDHHVPSPITEGLTSRGVDAITAREDDATRLDDELLLARATLLNRVLFSQDQDLLIIANRWMQDGINFAGLVYAHQLATTIGQAVRDLELMALALDPEDMRNRIEFLPL